jgi:hypothetical protein
MPLLNPVNFSPFPMRFLPHLCIKRPSSTKIDKFANYFPVRGFFGFSEMISVEFRLPQSLNNRREKLKGLVPRFFLGIAERILSR